MNCTVSGGAGASGGRAECRGLSTAHISPQASAGRPRRGVAADLRDRVAVSVGGSSVHLRKGQVSLPSVGGGARGVVSSFSSGSRRRLLHQVMSVNQNVIAAGRAWFVTLTYPGKYSADPTVWKRDLDTFLKRMDRTRFGLAGWWKLEAQRRGAPHYHLLVVASEAANQVAFREWSARSWYEVVGSGDERHLRAGTSCESVGSWKAVAKYAGKYFGKGLKADEFKTESGDLVADQRIPQMVDSDGVVTGGGKVSLGRFWGAFKRDCLPIAHEVYSLGEGVYDRFRRTLLKYAGRRVPSRKTGAWVFCRDETVLRLLTFLQGPSGGLALCSS